MSITVLCVCKSREISRFEAETLEAERDVILCVHDGW